MTVRLVGAVAAHGEVRGVRKSGEQGDQMGGIGLLGLGIMVLRMPEPLHAARKAEQARLAAEPAASSGGS